MAQIFVCEKCGAECHGVDAALTHATLAHREQVKVPMPEQIAPIGLVEE